MIRTVTWVALLVPVLIVVAIILRYGVNVPFAEEWDFVDFFVAERDGMLGWHDMWAPHNEHRMPVPKLFMLWQAPVTRWNLVIAMVFNAGLALSSLLVLLALARPVLRDAGPWTRVWAILTLSLLVFSLAQAGNWLWAWQVQWFLAVFAAILSIALLTWSLERTNPWPHLVGAVLAGLVCQYSLASGAAIWGLGVLVIAFHPRRVPLLALWSIVALASVTLYAIGYERHAGLPSLLIGVTQPLALVRYVDNYLAGALGRFAGVGIVAFLAFSALARIAARRHWQRPALFMPWVALAGFAVANAVLTGFGRVGMGADQALTSRYVTISLLLPAALVPLGVLVFRQWPAGWRPSFCRVAGIAGAVLLAGPVIATDIRRLPEIRKHSRMMTAGRDCVLALQTASDACLANLHPDPAAVRRRAPELEDLGLSVFAPEGAR